MGYMVVFQGERRDRKGMGYLMAVVERRDCKGYLMAVVERKDCKDMG